MAYCTVCKREISEEGHKPSLSSPNLCGKAACRRRLDERRLGKLNKTHFTAKSGEVEARPGAGQERGKTDKEEKIIGSLYDSVRNTDLPAFQVNVQRLREHLDKHKYARVEIDDILNHVTQRITGFIFNKELERMPPEVRNVAPPPFNRVKAIQQLNSILENPESGIPETMPKRNLSKREHVRARIHDAVKSYFLQVSKELTGDSNSIQKHGLPDDYIYYSWFK